MLNWLRRFLFGTKDDDDYDGWACGCEEGRYCTYEEGDFEDDDA